MGSEKPTHFAEEIHFAGHVIRTRMRMCTTSHHVHNRAWFHYTHACTLSSALSYLTKNNCEVVKLGTRGSHFVKDQPPIWQQAYGPAVCGITAVHSLLMIPYHYTEWQDCSNMES